MIFNKLVLPLILGIFSLILNSYIVECILNKAFILWTINFHITYMQAMLILLVKPIFGLSNHTANLIEIKDLIKNAGKSRYKSEAREMIIGCLTNIFFYLTILGALCLIGYMSK